MSLLDECVMTSVIRTQQPTENIGVLDSNDYAFVHLSNQNVTTFYIYVVQQLK